MKGREGGREGRRVKGQEGGKANVTYVGTYSSKYCSILHIPHCLLVWSVSACVLGGREGGGCVLEERGVDVCWGEGGEQEI